jgi:hypothetical protein
MRWKNYTLKTFFKNLIKEIKDINGNIAHIHGVEELKLLKNPQYPKCSIDSMQ